MKINFLEKTVAKNYFKDPDDYASKLNNNNLKIIGVKSNQEYHKLFIDSFQDFSEEEKTFYKNSLKALDYLNIEINLVKTSNAHSLDIIQTRKEVIVVPNGTPPSPVLFCHEVFHILSRKHGMSDLYSLFGFEKCQEEKINDPEFILNPDCTTHNYKIKITAKDIGEFEGIPYLVMPFETKLKVCGEELYIKAPETNLREKAPLTSYLSHPEEVCAEYFTFIHTGSCLFLRDPRKTTLVQQFEERLSYLLKNLNIK